ncbi:MAG: hypothetical protein KF847_20000 [Pirellulales bacterium]|nr:hypothetical protein [Pirellulales bacterium]
MAGKTLSQILLPILREKYPDRGLRGGDGDGPCAFFPGVHPGIRGVSIYDDDFELTICIDDLTHGHFSDFENQCKDAETLKRIIQSAIEFLDDLFADKVAVWGEPGVGGGWRYLTSGGELNAATFLGNTVSPTEYLWSCALDASDSEP